MVTPQFVNVGAGSTLDLQTLKATGDNASDNVQIQVLDAYGRTQVSYDWNDWAASTACWVDGDWNPVEEVSISAGQGLWVMGSASTQGILSAGKVGRDDVVVVLRNGGTGAGNPFPVSIDLQDIVAEGDEASDNVQIQVLDAYGRTVASYDWNDWANATACWVDGDWNPVENVTIEPGQGLWVMGSSTSQSIRFSSPTL
jgi:hypothetical protein